MLLRFDLLVLGTLLRERVFDSPLFVLRRLVVISDGTLCDSAIDRPSDSTKLKQ